MEEHSETYERRKFIRIDCLKAGRIVSVGTPSSDMVNKSAGLTKNVSAGGLLFADARQYHIGQLLVIEISPEALNDLGINDRKVIKTRGYVLGKIVRVEDMGEANTHDYGVCFVKVDETDCDYFSIFQDLLNRIEFDQL